LIDRTTIIIAHRLSTIRNVDRILVLKQGEVIESGTHDQLITKQGVYASLYELEMMATN
jgi:ATP-binding cassette subfamily B multidrug efflux pump